MKRRSVAVGRRRRRASVLREDQACECAFGEACLHARPADVCRELVYLNLKILLRTSWDTEIVRERAGTEDGDGARRGAVGLTEAVAAAAGGQPPEEWFQKQDEQKGAESVSLDGAAVNGEGVTVAVRRDHRGGLLLVHIADDR